MGTDKLGKLKEKFPHNHIAVEPVNDRPPCFVHIIYKVGAVGMRDHRDLGIAYVN